MEGKGWEVGLVSGLSAVWNWIGLGLGLLQVRAGFGWVWVVRGRPGLVRLVRFWRAPIGPKLRVFLVRLGSGWCLGWVLGRALFALGLS